VGKLIGKEGRMINSIKTVISGCKAKGGVNYRVNVEAKRWRREQDRFLIAQIGKTHGLRGDLKLHFHTDFPEQFKVGYSFDSSHWKAEVSRINQKRGTIALGGYDQGLLGLMGQNLLYQTG